jgi:hypothetical protein
MSEAHRGRPEAAAAIWTWQGSAPTAPAPTAGRVRLRGLAQAAVGAAAGAAILAFASRPLGIVVLSIASAIALAALVSPQGLFAGIERAFAALGHQIGRVLTWILLPAIFYLFFVPFSALFRRGRRDSMKRFFDASAQSYWKLRDDAARAGSPAAGRYRL